MRQQLQAIVTVLSLVNPLVCGAMFAQIEAQRSILERRADAIKVTLAVLIILSGAALIGTELLHLFGVSLDAFMVAGGGVLAWMGYSMLSGHGSSATPNGPSGTSASLTPLILFAASPGTITGVITLCRPRKVRISSNSPDCNRSGKCSYLAGHGACGTRRPSIRRRWICARRGYAFHGADHHFDGGAVCAYWTAPVRHLDRSLGQIAVGPNSLHFSMN
jgi:MarC family integral membrane protein